MSESDCNETRNGPQPLAESASIGALSKRPHPTDPNRWADGTLRPEHSVSVVHGATRRHPGALHAGLRAEMRAQVVGDLGVPERELTATLSSLVDRFTEASLLCSAYYTWLEEQGGPIGTRGRQRAAVSGYFAALDRQMKLALALGLERRARSLTPSSPSAYLEAQASNSKETDR